MDLLDWQHRLHQNLKEKADQNTLDDIPATILLDCGLSPDELSALVEAVRQALAQYPIQDERFWNARELTIQVALAEVAYGFGRNELTGLDTYIRQQLGLNADLWPHLLKRILGWLAWGDQPRQGQSPMQTLYFHCGLPAFARNQLAEQYLCWIKA